MEEGLIGGCQDVNTAHAAVTFHCPPISIIDLLIITLGKRNGHPDKQRNAVVCMRVVHWLYGLAALWGVMRWVQKHRLGEELRVTLLLWWVLTLWHGMVHVHC